MQRPRGLRWTNVPVPEPHVAGMVVGELLGASRPWRLGLPRGVARTAGWGLVGFGAVIVAWAVAAVDDVDVAQPASLVTAGPYAHSRNPMYVGWTAMYAGVVLLRDSAWHLLCLPVVLAATRRTIQGEERRLERRFGAEFDAYRESVRRYL